MEILDQHSVTWITAVIEDRWVQAKINDKPSLFGVNGGRVLMLAIGKTADRDSRDKFLEQMDYNFQRQVDFNNLPEGLLEEILEELENVAPAITPTDDPRQNQ